MFSAKIKQQVLSEYLQGTLSLSLMKKYGSKATDDGLGLETPTD